ncbi:hypothetical protein J3459_018057 [Metarhizium acridum]|uniref:uncharacterized protein n=1 Tax=Metarhizium acridum TaxID=92637 RepID=UPI001C6B7E73|nr:hypothetical protein J3459_018057 [Metarhizium acridum]KAG8410247.1 hypothetical protein J3458_017963 [Metarhizium acridum]
MRRGYSRLGSFWNKNSNCQGRLGWKVKDAWLSKGAQKAQKAYDELVEKIKHVKQYSNNGIMDNVAISSALENGAVEYTGKLRIKNHMGLEGAVDQLPSSKALAQL